MRNLMSSMRDNIYKLLNELDDLLLIFSIDSPQVKELIQEVRRELERTRDEVGTENATALELPQVPAESSHTTTVYLDDLLSDSDKYRLGKVDFKELFSAIWRKHAGKRHHMRWSDDGEMGLVIDGVVGVRMERMQDGIRFRLMPHVKR
jgi:hypothetical protein